MPANGGFPGTDTILHSAISRHILSRVGEDKAFPGRVGSPTNGTSTPDGVAHATIPLAVAPHLGLLRPDLQGYKDWILAEFGHVRWTKAVEITGIPAEKIIKARRR